MITYKNMDHKVDEKEKVKGLRECVEDWKEKHFQLLDCTDF